MVIYLFTVVNFAIFLFLVLIFGLKVICADCISGSFSVSKNHPLEIIGNSKHDRRVSFYFGNTSVILLFDSRKF